MNHIMISKLILLRHGKTVSSGKYIGSTNIGLADEGIVQVEKLAPIIARESADHVVCSPLLRCRETLKLLDLSGNATIDDDLREINFGEWEEKSFDEVSTRYPDLIQEWALGKMDFCFPGGEGLRDFKTRLEQVKKRLINQDVETLLVVTHGGVIRHMICSILGLPFEHYLLFRILESRYTVLDIYREGGVLAGLNLGGGQQ